VADFPTGANGGFAILADGMGGHAAGDVASKIVVSEVFAALKLRADDLSSNAGRIGALLQDAAEGANTSLGAYVAARPDQSGMGTTLLAPLVVRGALHWISVGDSPLYLFREGRGRRLNENHAMAERLDQWVAEGRISEHAAQTHPDRHCVTSVLMGREVHEVDVDRAPVALSAGDIILAASDGIETLSLAEMADALCTDMNLSSTALAEKLQQRVLDQADPDQDNLAFCVIRVLPNGRPIAPVVSPQSTQQCKPRLRRLTFAAVASRREGELAFETLTRSSS